MTEYEDTSFSALGLIARFEYRRDWSDVDFFTKGTNRRNNQNTFTAGFVYVFSTRQ